MLILHTADLHLTSKDPSRLKVLEWIIDKGNEKKVELVIIAGDLFDSDAEASILRTEARKIFERSQVRVLLLPGNHDAESYGLNYDYGQTIKQLIKKPFEIFEIKNIKIIGVPYQKAKFSECIMDLPGDIDMLVLHGTLYDLSILPILNIEDAEYMPIYPAEIENLCRCVLLGHIHSTYIDLNYDKTRVVYSGAPIALNTKCRSPRKVVLIEIDEQKFNITPLEIDIAPYWQEMNYFVFPGNEELIINKIEAELRELSAKKILPAININGYIHSSEVEFKERINQIIEKFKSNFQDISFKCDDIRSWDRLLKNHFVQRFIEKTSKLEDKLRMKILELTFPHLDDILK